MSDLSARLSAAGLERLQPFVTDCSLHEWREALRTKGRGKLMSVLKLQGVNRLGDRLALLVFLGQCEVVSTEVSGEAVDTSANVAVRTEAVMVKGAEATAEAAAATVARDVVCRVVAAAVDAHAMATAASVVKAVVETALVDQIMQEEAVATAAAEEVDAEVQAEGWEEERTLDHCVAPRQPLTLRAVLEDAGVSHLQHALRGESLRCCLQVKTLPLWVCNRPATASFAAPTCNSLLPGMLQ